MVERHNVAVTGAAGYIGSRILYNLLEDGHNVFPIDNFYSSQIQKEDVDINIHDIDIRDRKSLREILKKVDAVFHLAAVSGVEECSEKNELAFDVNVIGTQNVAWICREYNIPLVFPCSMAIIGEPEEFPIDQSHPRNPVNHYGLTKLMNEEDIKRLAEGEFPSHIYIKSNLYGNHTFEDNLIDKKTVINIFVDKAINKEPLTVHKPGTQARDFIHVKDVARAYTLSLKNLLDTEGSGSFTFPIASGEDRSILDIAQIVKKVVEQERGYTLDIKLVENPRGEEAAGEDFTVDTKKAKKIIGFETKHTIESTVRDMVKK